MHPIREITMTVTAPLLGLVQEAGESVLTLTEGLAQGELLGSRLTRAEVSRHLGALASAMKNMPDEVIRAMPEIDWGGWRGVEASLRSEGPAREDALWFGVCSLVPATLSWLRVYRQSSPEMFTYWS
jgi:hypothetical protein